MYGAHSKADEMGKGLESGSVERETVRLEPQIQWGSGSLGKHECTETVYCRWTSTIPPSTDATVDAFWRLECEGSVGVARVDPKIKRL